MGMQNYFIISDTLIAKTKNHLFTRGCARSLTVLAMELHLKYFNFKDNNIKCYKHVFINIL